VALAGWLFQPMEYRFIDRADPATGGNRDVQHRRADGRERVFNATGVAGDEIAPDGFQALPQSRGLDDQNARFFRMAGEELDQGSDGGAHLARRFRSSSGDGSVERSSDIFTDQFQNRGINVFLVSEIEVEATDGAAGRADDHGDGGGVKSFAAEQADGGLEQALAAV
jgi:hypothetical protein